MKALPERLRFLHEGTTIANFWYTVECTCGWSSGVTNTEAEAHEVFMVHRARAMAGFYAAEFVLIRSRLLRKFTSKEYRGTWREIRLELEQRIAHGRLRSDSGPVHLL